MVIVVTILAILIAEFIRFYLINAKNARLQRLIIKFEKEFNYLSTLTDSITDDSLPIDQSFTGYLNNLKNQLGWTFHSIFRLDEEKQVLVIRFTGSLPDWYMKELSSKVLVRVGDASVGRAVATKQPATINVANSDPRFKNVQSLTGQTGYKSLSCYPLVGRIKTYGGFCTYSAQENVFTLQDIQFFLVCSNIYASILELRLIEKYLSDKK